MSGALDLDDLYAASYRRLVVQILALCGDVRDGEDAVQEAFVTAIRKQRQLRHVDNPEAWIRTVAVNRVRAGWRHASVVRKYQPRIPGPQAPVEINPDHVALNAALAQIDPDQREVLVLHHLADLGVSEIALELGIPAGTVKSRLTRGRARLADLLADEEVSRDA